MATNGTMTKTKATKKEAGGFVLSCPVCGEGAVAITLDLSDLTTCHCSSCDDDFAVATAVKILSDRLAQWVRVAKWIQLAGDVIADADAGLDTEAE